MASSLSLRPVDDDQPGADQRQRQEDADAERLLEQQAAAQHAEDRRQEGEARQPRRRIAAHQPEPQDIGDGDDVDRLEQQRGDRHRRDLAEHRPGKQQHRQRHHGRNRQLVEQQLFGAGRRQGGCRLMTSVVAAQNMPAPMLMTSPMIADGLGRLSLSENTSDHAGEGQRQPAELGQRHVFAKQEMRADQHPERHRVDHQRAARRRSCIRGRRRSG